MSVLSFGFVPVGSRLTNAEMGAKAKLHVSARTYALRRLAAYLKRQRY